MNVAHLIKMANQISAFFEAMPDKEQAVKDIASHIVRNWEPRMRAELLAHVARSGDGELNELMRRALPLTR
jgi:formate dehydrogenase subunit delta